MKLSDAIGLELERRDRVPSGIPERVSRCTTHHYACDCREYEFAQAKARIEELEHYNIGLANESASQQARIEALENPNKERQVFAAKMLATFTQPDVDCYLLAGIIYTAMQEPQMAAALLQE